VGAIKYIRLDVVPASGSQHLESPWHTQAGWNTTFGSANTVVATGPAIGAAVQFTFTDYFSGAAANPMNYVYSSYGSAGNWQEACLLTRTAGFTSGLTYWQYGWYYKSYSAAQWNPGKTPPSDVPEPVGLVAIGLGLIAACGLRRKRSS
jgi:hypothetical protein